MNRHDCARFARHDGFFDTLRVKQERIRINIYEGNSKPAVQRRGSAGYEREVGNYDLATVVETIVIEHCGQSDAQCVSAVWQQQPIFTTAVLRPLLSKLLRQWLRHTFYATRKNSAERGTNTVLPLQRIAVVISGPGVKTRITYRFPAIPGQFSGQA